MNLINRFKKTSISLLLGGIGLTFFVTGNLIIAQDIPFIYITLYDQSFTADSSIRQFEYSDPSLWKLTSESSNRVLEYKNNNNDSISNGTPYSIALLSNQKYGDFILETQFKQLNVKKEEPVDFCIYFGVRSAENFYCVRLSDDSSKTNIYKYNGIEWVVISDSVSVPIKLAHAKWHKVRIERDIVHSTTTVYLDNSKSPVLRAMDRTYRMGAVGFGTFANNLRVDNIKIWGPTVVDEKTGFLKKKE